MMSGRLGLAGGDGRFGLFGGNDKFAVVYWTLRLEPPGRFCAGPCAGIGRTRGTTWPATGASVVAAPAATGHPECPESIAPSAVFSLHSIRPHTSSLLLFPLP